MQPERPPIPNRGEEVTIIGHNMLNFYIVLRKWNHAAERVIARPSRENVEKFRQLDEILRDLMALLPELEQRND